MFLFSFAAPRPFLGEVEEQEKMRKELEQKEADVALVEETANNLEGSLYKITDSLEWGQEGPEAGARPMRAE